MLQTEYSFETELEVRGAEEREAGILLGIEQGKREGIRKGRLAGKREGIRRGRMEGRMEGIYAKAIETARNCLALNISIETIAKITGFSQEEILKL